MEKTDRKLTRAVCKRPLSSSMADLVAATIRPLIHVGLWRSRRTQDQPDYVFDLS